MARTNDEATCHDPNEDWGYTPAAYEPRCGGEGQPACTSAEPPDPPTPEPPPETPPPDPPPTSEPPPEAPPPVEPPPTTSTPTPDPPPNPDPDPPAVDPPQVFVDPCGNVIVIGRQWGDIHGFYAASSAVTKVRPKLTNYLMSSSINTTTGSDPTTPGAAPQVITKFCRDASYIEIPYTVDTPSGLTPVVMMSENYNSLAADTNPPNWVAASSVRARVVDFLSYTCSNSMRVEFFSSARDNYLSRALAPHTLLTDAQPVVLQFFLNYGAKDSQMTFAVYNKTILERTFDGPLFEINRSAYEQQIYLKPGELVVQDSTAGQYYYTEPPAEYELDSDGYVQEIKYSTKLGLRDRTNVQDVMPRDSSQTVADDPRLVLYEQFQVRYYNGTAQTTETYTVEPYITDPLCNVKMYGWNCITAVMYAHTFDLYINGYKLIDRKYYLVEEETGGTTGVYAGMFYVGLPYSKAGTITGTTKGSVFIDNLDLYICKNIGSVRRPSTPIPDPEPPPRTDDGCIILTINDLQLMPDARGAITYSNYTPEEIHYIEYTETYIDDKGIIVVGHSNCVIKKADQTNVEIKSNGQIIVGGPVENRLDALPFDYQLGEIVLFAALNTNDTRRTPSISRIFFELD